MRTIEPLELKLAILREIDNGIIAVGDGQRLFPHASIEIRLLVLDEASGELLRAAFIDNKLLETAIHNQLKPPRCDDAQPLVTIVLTQTIDETQIKKGFEIVFPSRPREEAYLEVLEGLANRKQLRLQHVETFIGRCEQTDSRGSKNLRKNDLYFVDAREFSGRVPKDLKQNEEVNQSVSRTHAHISFSEKDRCYYIYDDGSSKGTTILRGGRGVAESVHRNIGKELKNGDVVCLGKAKVRFRIRTDELD